MALHTVVQPSPPSSTELLPSCSAATLSPVHDNSAPRPRPLVTIILTIILLSVCVHLTILSISYDWNLLICLMNLKITFKQYGLFSVTKLRRGQNRISHFVFHVAVIISTCPTASGAEALLTCVGVMWLTSSGASCVRRELPALSKARGRSHASWFGALFNLRKIESKPIPSSSLTLK